MNYYPIVEVFWPEVIAINDKQLYNSLVIISFELDLRVVE